VLRTAIAGLVVGGGVGALMARGGICFNTGVREAAFEHRWRVLRIFALGVSVQMLLLPVVIAAGVPVSRIGLYPVAELAGGLVFGAGMALAGGCVTGIMWRAGSGSIALAIAVAGFGAGEIAIRDRGRELLHRLDRAGGHPSTTTVFGLLHVRYAPLAVAIGLAATAAILARSRRDLWWGAALAGLAAAAWVAADWVGYGYGLGFVGTAANVRSAVRQGSAGALSFEAFLAAGVVLGAALAGWGGLRLPTPARAARALAGGLLMGFGGNIAHGCNIGHGLTGIPLLSLGSILAAAAMAAGAVATRGLLLEPFPALRGREHDRPRAR
jgi:uncharacterized protein